MFFNKWIWHQKLEPVDNRNINDESDSWNKLALLENCPNTEFFLVRIFLYLDQKKLCIWTLFTQCNFYRKVEKSDQIDKIIKSALIFRFTSNRSTEKYNQWIVDFLTIISLFVLSSLFKFISSPRIAKAFLSNMFNTAAQFFQIYILYIDVKDLR